MRPEEDDEFTPDIDPDEIPIIDEDLDDDDLDEIPDPPDED